MSAVKRCPLFLNLKRLLQGLLTISAMVCGAGALAQGSTVDCAVSSGACLAECSASGVIGSILGGGGAADRKAKLDQCRAGCERDRLTCQAQASPASPSTTPSAPVAGSTGTPAGSASSAPATRPAGIPAQQPVGSTTPGSEPTSADGESIVLLTVKSKPLSNVAQPITYVRQALSEAEARQHMRPTWGGLAPVHQAESGTALIIYGSPMMTRRKLVEATLVGYERSGGKRGDIKVEVLSAGVAVAPPVVAAPQSAQAPPRTTGSSPGPAVASSAGSATGRGTCLEFLRREEQHGGDLAFYANRCAHAVHTLMEYGDSCLSSKIEPNLWSMFKVGPGQYKIVRACKAVDRQSTQRCECSAGSDLPADMAYYQSSLAASYQQPVQTATPPTASNETCFGLSRQGDNMYIARNNCNYAVIAGMRTERGCETHQYPPGQAGPMATFFKWQVMCRYPAGAKISPMGIRGDCVCPPGTTSFSVGPFPN